MLDGNFLNCMEATGKVIREIGHDQADCPSASPLEHPSSIVGCIAYFGDSLYNSGASLGFDAGIVIDYARYRHYADVSFPGDIENGWWPVAPCSFQSSHFSNR
jgi:hypothetical protein